MALYLSPVVISFHAIRAILLASAIATSLGLRLSNATSHEAHLLRPARLTRGIAVAPITSALRNASSPARVMMPIGATPSHQLFLYVSNFSL
jgi:hypothetical protein